ncbi:MAG: hypothetical protein KC506_03715 [Nanoarchaeota archaeon]|nr:hypothetical protein [Nanoarchaeota archaeon]
MFLVVHVLLGTLIGLQYQSLLLVVIFSFVSHFLLDVLPHWDSVWDKNAFTKNFHMKFNTFSTTLVVIDSLLAFYLIYVLQGYFGSSLVIVGGLAAMAPDLVKLGFFTPLRKVKWYQKHLIWHARIQRETGVLFGLFTQVVTAGLLIWALFF